MKYENIRGFKHFPFNLYENPLASKRYRKFLENPDYAGKDRHSIPNELEDRLEQAMRILYHITHDFDRLERSKVYDVINAKSMHHLLDAAIKYYDFRTSELVRLLFEASIIFLKNSKKSESEKDKIEDSAKLLSKSFQELSHSLLQDEDLDKNISKEEQEKIKNYLQRHYSKRDSDEYKMLEKYNRNLYDELIEQDVHERIISKEITITSPLDPMLPNFRSRKEIIEQIRKNKEEMMHLQGESFIREGTIWRLSNAYNHLESYACRIKPLEEFENILGIMAFDRPYLTDVGKEFKHLEIKKEFDKTMYEKYKNKAGFKNRPELKMSSQGGKGGASIPMDVYKIEMKKFFEKKGVDLEYDTGKKQNPKVKNSTEYRRYMPKWIRNEID